MTLPHLLLADLRRLWARRITRFFPLVLAAMMVVGVVIAYLVMTSNDTTIDFVNDVAGGVSASEILGPVADLLPVMAFVIGASYVGADLKSGMVEQILTWEPRRNRFVFSRAVAGLTTVAVIAMALAVFLIGLLYALTIAVDGSTRGITGELWVNAAVAVGRTGLACGLFCVIGIAVTMVVNSSVGSITGFVIYWFIIESFLVSSFLPRVAAWLPVTNAAAFAKGRSVERIDGSVFSESFEMIEDHGYLLAGLVLLAYAVGTLLIAGWLFRRRDID